MKNNFRIHCIALTKNEADVVESCLRDATKWADRIYVYDGGSTDGTWEIVQRMDHPAIIPWRQDPKVFREGLRAEVFEAFRGESQTGDWWLQLNVDEFYPRCPRQFFKHVPAHYSFVWGINVEYKITEKDVENIDFSGDFELVRPKLRHYMCDWSEPRAFRYRPRLTWSDQDAWPRHVGLVAKERITFQHYPYRSPSQIQTRLDVRRENRARGFEGWQHASQETWQEKIVPSTKCLIDDGGPFKIDQGSLPRYLENASTRIIKRMLHGVGIWP